MGSFRTWSLAVAAAIFVVIVAHQRSAAGVGTAPTTAAAPVAATDTSTPGPGRVTGLPDFSGLVAENGPAVVYIQVTEKAPPRQSLQLQGGNPDGDDPLSQFFRRFQQQVPQQQLRPRTGVGSGFIVSSDGYVLTNAHVVQDAAEVTVQTHDRREFRAKVIGVDKGSDVALIKIPANSLPTVKFGDPAKLRPGQWAIAIGAPFGFESSVTAGVISAVDRQVPSDDGAQSYVTFIQTDAAVNPGNSGGPLFNIDGQVIGINSQIYSRSGGYMGVSFAIPIDYALNVKDQLLKTGKVARSRIGVEVQEVKQQLAQSFGLPSPHGALVSRVEPNGPSDKAGLKSGDVIVAVNGKYIEHSWDLPAVISQIPPGSMVKLGLWRDRKATDVSLKTVLLDETPALAARTSEEDSGGKLGLQVRPLEAREQQELKTKGKLVIEQVSGPALAAGLQEGDVVLGVNGVTVTTVAELKREVAKAGNNVALLIQREDRQSYVPLDLG
ncbi:MAG TPA: Do family serine endopeptidase [Steroidobacteraceae bacterium]|jgi:serine protease Do